MNLWRSFSYYEDTIAVCYVVECEDSNPCRRLGLICPLWPNHEMKDQNNIVAATSVKEESMLPSTSASFLLLGKELFRGGLVLSYARTYETSDAQWEDHHLASELAPSVCAYQRMRRVSLQTPVPDSEGRKTIVYASVEK